MNIFGKVRLLPMMIIVGALVLGLRVSGLWLDSGSDATGISTALAAGDDNKDAEKDDEQDVGEPVLFTRGEVDMLQSLQTRREKLDEREDGLRLKEDLLKVTEKRIEEKITELK